MTSQAKTDAAESERCLRRALAAERVASLPIVEHALDLYANGGPDMRAEAEALAALLKDFSERMRRDGIAVQVPR